MNKIGIFYTFTKQLHFSKKMICDKIIIIKGNLLKIKTVI